MKFSKKSYYGLRAVLALASTSEPVSTHDLSVLECLPEDYLEKILQSLRKAGIVEAKKGAEGGYILSPKSKTLTAWDVVFALDGDIKPFAPPKRTSNILPCPKLSHCQTNEVWRLLERDMKRTLSRIKITSLIPSITHHR